MNVADVLPANWTSFFSPTGLRIGIGVDPATTTKKKSNPTGISVLQQDGVMIWARLVLRFKTDDDRVTTALIGASKISQLEECVAAVSNTVFDQEELQKIEAILKA